eukprot:TRINITY_DN557_c3_g1_i2.p1 TRINITY_DN557_c3_g1~~TRINITY_DN557_c3_g1_i2.p1  ORF type:complete len:521 (+),score=86.24 TRINITY_DN557_c3_g1_i2:429-1991(+)
MMLDKMYDTDFREMEGGVFIEEVMRLKIEPMLRPRIPSLLNPQFGRTLLNYFLKQMERLNMKRLIIYEVWGHNGQTALSILDILEEEYPHIYSTCEYHMVDVLGAWMTHRDSVIKAHHYDHYFEHHISFFDWEVMVPDRVFFVCLEALSYLPFDRVDVVKSSHRGSTQFNFYELCMCEDINPDDRMEYSPYGLYSKIRSKDWYRPLQDGLIMEYLRHVDMGYFTKERLEQHRYDCLYGDGDNLGDVSEMKAFKRYNPAIGKLKSGATHEEAAYHKMGMLNNQFWVPSMQVSLFDVLRKYFPRHIFVCLDQTDQHTFIPGVKAPTMRQYFGGTYYDMRHYYLHENMMGVTDCRLNISFDDVRTLYYGMMELPPGHPLHLRCVSLRAFFEEYASEDIMKAITVGKEGNRYSQPVDQFMGGKLLVTEFGADLEDIQDKPIDVAICKGHWRQRAYNTICKYLKKARILSDDSLWDLSSRDMEKSPKQVLDPTPVREAIGPNPTFLQLDQPIGYKADKDHQFLEQ